MADQKDRPAISDKAFQELVDSISGGFVRDQDKLKRIKTATDNFTFACVQLNTLVEKTPAVVCDTVTTVYPALHDKDKFSTVLSKLKFKEDRDDISKRLSLH